MSERILEFTVEKQLLQKKAGCDFSGIVAGSVGYLKAKFHFSNEWDKCAKVASFGSPDLDDEWPVLLDENDMCDIPAEVLRCQVFTVTVIGGKKPLYRINTNKIKVKQEVNE